MNDKEPLRGRYERQLQPYIEFLRKRKSVMNRLTWNDTVRRVEQSVLKSPEQFFIFEFSPKERALFISIVKSVFEDLLTENQ